MKLTDAFGLPPALRHATTPLQPGLEELEAHMESTTTLNPGIQGPVSLDNFGNYFYYNDFYSDVRPFEVKHDFDFCKLGGAETVNYDLERHIRRYSSSKLRKKNFRHAGVLAKSGVLTEKDSISQNHEMLKCTNN